MRIPPAASLPQVELAPGTLVIGDLHLDLDEPQAVAAFERWLEGISGAPRLIVLGDLFEYWLGRAHLETPGARAILAAFERFTRAGGALDVVPGNRDFLLDARFERASGARVRPSGMLGRTGAGRRIAFLHGDELCTLDRRYQRLRGVLRSRPLRAFAAALPRPVLAMVARRLRRASRRAVAAKPRAETAQQPDACRAWARALEVDVLVCGHAHRFRDEELPDGPRWLVVDAFGGRRDTLRLAPDGVLAPLEHAGPHVGPDRAPDAADGDAANRGAAGRTSGAPAEGAREGRA